MNTSLSVWVLIAPRVVSVANPVIWLTTLTTKPASTKTILSVVVFMPSSVVSSAKPVIGLLTATFKSLPTVNVRLSSLSVLSLILSRTSLESESRTVNLVPLKVNCSVVFLISRTVFSVAKPLYNLFSITLFLLF